MSAAPPIWFALYEEATGRIRQACLGMEAEAGLWLQPGEAYVVVGGPVNNGTSYIRNGRLVARPSLSLSKTTILADGADMAVIDDLPMPCAVTIDGVETIVPDGRLELVSATAHTWSVTILDPFPFQRYSAVITALEA